MSNVRNCFTSIESSSKTLFDFHLLAITEIVAEWNAMEKRSPIDFSVWIEISEHLVWRLGWKICNCGVVQLSELEKKNTF